MVLPVNEAEQLRDEINVGVAAVARGRQALLLPAWHELILRLLVAWLGVVQPRAAALSVRAQALLPSRQVPTPHDKVGVASATDHPPLIRLL